LTTTFNVLTGKSISVPGPSEVRLYDAGGRLVCRDLQAVRGAWRPSIAVPAGRYVVQVIPANGRSIPQSR
ncbi:MAG TPA: hypothetical protein VHO70_23230, partial [Chitinispirillaceae bacterium]|nr:hypothetical protein [Chitinispirillaceae bacterium]